MGTMKTLAKSKVGLVLVATAAIGLCAPAYATHGHHRHQPPARHHHNNSGGGGGGPGLGFVLGIAALGALIVASHANSRPEPVAVYTPPPQPTYAPVPVPQHIPPPPATETLRNEYWYFCPSANGYFPYVQQCSQPWIAVPPTPPVPHAPPGP